MIPDRDDMRFLSRVRGPSPSPRPSRPPRVRRDTERERVLDRLVLGSREDGGGGMGIPRGLRQLPMPVYFPEAPDASETMFTRPGLSITDTGGVGDILRWLLLEREPEEVLL